MFTGFIQLFLRAGAHDFRVKDIPSSVLIVEEGENPPDLVKFVRETLGGQAEVLKM